MNTKLNINEERKNLSGYINVGEVPYGGGFMKRLKKMYVMVSPQTVTKYGRQVYDVIYSEKPDGSGLQTDDIPQTYKNEIVVYPEHRNDVYGEAILGKGKDKETLDKEHQEFESKLQKWNGYVVLHHDSNYKILDGVVKKGKTQGYSLNTDVGVYFWGSPISGKDPSNAGRFVYFCLIKPEELYDYQTNEERLSLKQALQKYPYAGQYWEWDKNAVCVNTMKSDTPIWRIFNKQDGKWYDANWNEIKEENKPVQPLNERMGFDDSIPQEFLDDVYKKYTKTVFAHRTPKWTAEFTVPNVGIQCLPETVTFTVECGSGNNQTNAQVFDDGSVWLNADNLSKMTPEQIKSRIAHEIVHLNQDVKLSKGDRSEGEFGFTKAENQGLIDRNKETEKVRQMGIWMIENLQEEEIEARLSQIYYYAKEYASNTDIRGSVTDAVSKIVNGMEGITKLKGLSDAISATEKRLSGTYAYFIDFFLKDAQSALYGSVGQLPKDLEGKRRVGFRLLEIYCKRFERYKRKVWNAVYQGIQDANKE